MLRNTDRFEFTFCEPQNKLHSHYLYLLVVYLVLPSFGSSTAGYATWLVIGIVLGEFLTGKGTDFMWRSVNYGKTFDTVDWSKFDPVDEDEEEEDDDDDDDDDE